MARTRGTLQWTVLVTALLLLFVIASIAAVEIVTEKPDGKSTYRYDITITIIIITLLYAQ